MLVETFEQYSPEWWAARVGRPSASCFGKIITPKTMKPSSQAEKYLYTLAGERIAGVKEETYQNAAMERGIIMEEEARNMFEMIQDVEVNQVGMIYPDENKMYSCSPDGLMDSPDNLMEEAGLEIKCPLISTHVAYLLAGEVPVEYIPQVQGSMLISGLSHWFFMSYYPGLPPLILKVPRDEKFCATLQAELESFCERLDRVEEQLRGLA